MSSGSDDRMTDKERGEHSKLLHLWATGKLTRAQILRCMELDRRSEKQAILDAVASKRGTP